MRPRAPLFWLALLLLSAAAQPAAAVDVPLVLRNGVARVVAAMARLGGMMVREPEARWAAGGAVAGVVLQWPNPANLTVMDTVRAGVAGGLVGRLAVQQPALRQHLWEAAAIGCADTVLRSWARTRPVNVTLAGNGAAAAAFPWRAAVLQWHQCARVTSPWAAAPAPRVCTCSQGAPLRRSSPWAPVVSCLRPMEWLLPTCGLTRGANSTMPARPPVTTCGALAPLVAHTRSLPCGYTAHWAAPAPRLRWWATAAAGIIAAAPWPRALHTAHAAAASWAQHAAASPLRTALDAAALALFAACLIVSRRRQGKGWACAVGCATLAMAAAHWLRAEEQLVQACLALLLWRLFTQQRRPRDAAERDPLCTTMEGLLRQERAALAAKVVAQGGSMKVLRARLAAHGRRNPASVFPGALHTDVARLWGALSAALDWNSDPRTRLTRAAIQALRDALASTQADNAALRRENAALAEDTQAYQSALQHQQRRADTAEAARAAATARAEQAERALELSRSVWLAGWQAPLAHDGASELSAEDAAELPEGAGVGRDNPNATRLASSSAAAPAAPQDSTQLLSLLFGSSSAGSSPNGSRAPSHSGGTGAAAAADAPPVQCSNWRDLLASSSGSSPADTPAPSSNGAAADSSAANAIGTPQQQATANRYGGTPVSRAWPGTSGGPDHTIVTVHHTPAMLELLTPSSEGTPAGSRASSSSGGGGGGSGTCGGASTSSGSEAPEAGKQGASTGGAAGAAAAGEASGCEEFEMQRLHRRVQSQRQRVVPMPHDGNSMFAALAHHLFRCASKHAAVRAAVAEHTQQHWTYYAAHAHAFESCQGYTPCVVPWQDDFVLQAAADLWHLRIVLLTSHADEARGAWHCAPGAVPGFEPPRAAPSCFMLGYTCSDGHFDALTDEHAA